MAHHEVTTTTTTCPKFGGNHTVCNPLISLSERKLRDPVQAGENNPRSLDVQPPEPSTIGQPIHTHSHRLLDTTRQSLRKATLAIPKTPCTLPIAQSKDFIKERIRRPLHDISNAATLDIRKVVKPAAGVTRVSDGLLLIDSAATPHRPRHLNDAMVKPMLRRSSQSMRPEAAIPLRSSRRSSDVSTSSRQAPSKDPSPCRQPKVDALHDLQPLLPVIAEAAESCPVIAAESPIDKPEEATSSSSLAPISSGDPVPEDVKESALNDAADLQKMIAQKEEQINQLKQEMQASKQANAMAEKETNSLKAVIKELQLKCSAADAHYEEVTILKLRVDELLMDREAQLMQNAARDDCCDEECQCDLLVCDWEAECTVLTSRLCVLQRQLQQEEEAKQALLSDNKTLSERCKQIHDLNATVQAKEATIEELQRIAEAVKQEAELCQRRIKEEVQLTTRKLSDDLQQAKVHLRNGELERQQLAHQFQLELSNAQTEAKTKAEAVVQEMQKMYKDKQQQHAMALEKEIQTRKALELRLEECQSQISQLQAANRRLTDQQGTSDAAKLEWQREKLLLQDRAAQSAEKCAALESRLTTAAEGLKNMETEHTEVLRKWKNVAADKERLIKEKDDLCHKLEQELAAALRDLHVTQNRATKAEAQSKAIAVELSAKEEELSAVTAKAEQAAKGLTEMEQQIKNLKDALDKATVDLAVATQTIGQKDQMGRVLERQLSDLETQWGKLGAEMRRKDHELAEKTLNSSDILSTLRETQCALDGKSERLEQQHQQLQASHQQLGKVLEEKRALQKEVEVLQVERLRLNKELQHLQSSVEVHQAQVTSLTQQCRTLDDARQEAVAKAQSLETVRQELEQKLAFKEQQLHEAQRSQGDEESQDLQLAKQAIRSLKEALASSREEVKRMQSASSDRTVDPLQYVRRQDADDLLFELSAKEEELMRKQLETLELQSKVKHLQRELEGASYNQQTRVLEAQIQQLQSKLQAVKAELKVKEEEAELFTQELEDRMKEHQSMAADLNQRGLQLQQLRSRVSDLEALSQEYTRRATSDSKTILDLQSENQNLQKTLAELIQQAGTTQERLHRESTEWSRRCGELREELARKATELSDAKQQLAAQEQQEQQQHVQWQAAQTIQVSCSNTFAEQSYDFCSGLIAKCTASPIPRLPSDEYSDLDSTMDLGIPITPIPRSQFHLSVSPTRVGWSPNQPNDEDVLLSNVPAVPFTSVTPIRPSRRRVCEAISVTCTEEVHFTISGTREGSTHWARLTSCRRGVRGVERWRRSAQVAHSRVPRMLCHPRMHQGVQQIQRRWSTLSQWFDQHRVLRRQGVQQRRCLPSPSAPAQSSQRCIEWQPIDRIQSPITEEPSAEQVVPRTLEDTDASIDARLCAGAQSIPSDLDLVPSLLFPANSRGPLESP